MSNRSMSSRIYAACLAGLFAVSCASLEGQSAPPSADTFVSSATPKTNYGSSPILIVQPGATAYLQFNLSSLPDGASVSKATLRLYVDAVVKAGSFDVYQVNSGWSESALNYNSPAPLLGISATGNQAISVTSNKLNQFVLVDVTALVQGWVNGSVPNNGLALALTTVAGNFSFDSKESLLTGNGPELEIVLNGGGAQGPQGPAGPAGPQGSSGPAGANGATGPIGPQGATGAAGPMGPAGPAGPQGLMGLAGPQGPQGGIGPQGAAGQGFNFRAAFDPTATYAAYDVVTFHGSSYTAKSAINPSDPAPDTNPNWSIFTEGTPGPAGPAGPAGPQGQAGPSGPVGPSGPQGVQGPQGISGLQGPPGPGGMAWRGAFDCAGTYSIGDVVTYQGALWVDVEFPIGGCVDPPFAPWHLLGSNSVNGFQEFTSDGTFTPPAGVFQFSFEAWGGGGYGPGASASGCFGSLGGGGGGAGGYVRALIPVTTGTVYTIQVGRAGTIGGDGTDSDVTNGASVLAAAKGGKAGGNASNSSCGSGGVGGAGGGFVGANALGRVGPSGGNGGANSGAGGAALHGTIDPIGGGGAGAGSNLSAAQPGYVLISY
jgi:hypothetical protein